MKKEGKRVFRNGTNETHLHTASGPFLGEVKSFGCIGELGMLFCFRVLLPNVKLFCFRVLLPLQCLGEWMNESIDGKERKERGAGSKPRGKRGNLACFLVFWGGQRPLPLGRAFR